MNYPGFTLTTPFCRRRAFTLVELLAVMGIIVVLLGLVLPAVTSVRNEGDVTKAIYDVSNSLDQARTYAVADNTYVWAVFTTPSSGVVTVTLYASKSQLRDLTATNLRQFSKAIQETSILLVSQDASLPAYGNRETPEAMVVAPNAIEFDPVGEARLIPQTTSTQSAPLDSTQQEPGIVRCIEVGLHPIRDGQTVGPNSAALQITGLTGQTRIFRP